MADQRALRLVLFRLGSLVCAAPATAVREVIPAGRPTRIPGTDAVIAGLLNLRGVLLTVVDGRGVIGVTDGAAAPESVLVLEQRGKPVGLAVDEVLDLVEVDPDQLAQGDALPGIDPRLVQAVGRQDGRVFAVLDVAALVAPLLS
jgi:purine-binding chemotaxis protein CheW